MFNKVSRTFRFGDNDVTLTTGEVARQASGACVVQMGDTVVLATVVAKKEAKEGQDFFPLTVDYVEKAYAAGRFPGGFFKREGRPSEHETLTSRLIDRPIRPLFPDGFYNEVQVICTVVSADPEVDPDIPAMLGASAALQISGIPFKGPIAGCRVGYINGQYVCNPHVSQMADSKLDLVVAGTSRAVLMVESEADRLPEDVMLGAVSFGHQQMQVAIEAINSLVEEAGKPAWDWQPPAKNEALIARIRELAFDGLKAAYDIRQKQPRSEKIRAVYELVHETLKKDAEAAGTEPTFDQNEVDGILFEMEAHLVRDRILRGEPRIDGRDTRTVRPIEIRMGVLPRTHGSALFTRGETQSLALTTLGTKQDEQIIDGLTAESRDRFIFHYNMPPFATGETGRIGSPKRREIGHGRLAKRALAAVLPDYDDFQYTIRVVSEICESNGSSQASVCGGCLSMIDAGVPLKGLVAGVAMGLIKEDNKFAILTDILGDEDHLGDMDFKVAGTEDGVTALQMDIKIDGITEDIMKLALAQAHDGRMHILGLMKEAVGSEKRELSTYAPRMITVKINPEKIRDVIGKGGSVIRGLVEETGCKIDVEEDGTVTISSADTAKAEEAKRRIEEIAAEVEVGQIYEGTVTRILDFGAIVQLLPGKDGLLHISQIANVHVDKVTDYLKEGQKVRVKVIEADEKGRVRLSMKALINDEKRAAQEGSDIQQA